MDSLVGLMRVFSEFRYLFFGALISIAVGLVMSSLDGLLFFYPSIVLYLPEDASVSFSLLLFIALLSGMLSSMLLYGYLSFKTPRMARARLGFLGPVFGLAAGVCGCSSVGFAIIASLGALGTAGTAFISNFQIPLRLASLSLLGVTLFYANRSITQQCKINRGKN